MFSGSFDNPDNYAIDLVNEQKLRYDFVYWWYREYGCQRNASLDRDF
jgi:hypothetical protein